jgi:hypothetical protein
MAKKNMKALKLHPTQFFTLVEVEHQDTKKRSVEILTNAQKMAPTLEWFNLIFKPQYESGYFELKQMTMDNYCLYKHGKNI